MICSSCRRTVLSRLGSSKRGSNVDRVRQTSSAPSSSPSPRQPPSDISLPSATRTSSPSAISSDTPGISQPLSTPILPSTSGASSSTASSSPAESARTGVRSKPEEQKKKLVGSIPGGTLLQGLGYLKAKPEVYAKEDEEYPAWLWTLLDPDPRASSSPSMDGKTPADVAESNLEGITALPKAAREKYLRRQEKFLQTLPKKIPLHEQSVDLTQPGDSAELSLQKRQEVVQSSRTARRKDIKEENFLRGL